MRTKNFLKHLILGALLLTTTVVVGQSTTPGNVAGGPGDFLGWENNPVNNFPLEIRHDLDQPIDFWTTQSFRARINPRISYPIGLAPNAPRDGFMLLSGQDNFPQNVRGPFTRLHLVDDVGTDHPVVYAQDIGYRQWMRNGITFTGNSDQAYIGQKYDGNDNTDFVIQWSDNPETQEWGTDRMKFIFSSEFTGDHTGMGSEYGLEAMRFWPKNAKEVNVGVGDFFAYGGDPTERLHVRDGRVRIQQLPDNPEAHDRFKVMVVDDSNDPLERGVVKWADMSGLGGNCSSGWSLMGNNAVTAFNGNPCPPQSPDMVGIGTSTPAAKLEVIKDVNTTTTPFDCGIWTRSFTTSAANFGGNFEAHAAPGLLSIHNIGVRGHVTNGERLYGVWGIASGIAGSTTVLGVRAEGGNMYGVATGSASSAIGATQAVGASGWASCLSSDPGTTSYGLYGRAVNGETRISVYGHSPGTGPNDWAAYFPGRCYFVNHPYNPSDGSLKTNVEPITDATGMIMGLHAKTYFFKADDYPQMGLPQERQYGFLAQELQTQFPEMVTEMTHPAELDSTGEVIYPPVTFQAVNTAGILPVLVAAVQEQKTRIDSLEALLAQCCAAGQGMAPQGSMDDKRTGQANELREQRLLIIPNPVADLTTLEYYVPHAGRVSLSVSTSDGKPMGTLREEQAEPGAYSYAWNTTKLAAGTYFCTFLLDDAVVVKRAVKVK